MCAQSRENLFRRPAATIPGLVSLWVMSRTSIQMTSSGRHIFRRLRKFQSRDILPPSGMRRRRLTGNRGKLRCQGNDGPHWRTGGHRQCSRLLGLARVRLDHGADADRGRRPNGLHRTCVVVVSPSALDALVCAPSRIPAHFARRSFDELNWVKISTTT